MSVNRAIILGNLGKDPVLSTSKTGNQVCEITVATTERYKVNNERKESVTWHRVVFFGAQADIIGKHFKKGNPIFVEGKIDNYCFTGTDGNKVYGSKIIGTNFSFVGAKDKNEEQPESKMEQQEQPTMGGEKETTEEDLPF